jgi:H+/Cl- antiporter ClcA
LAPESINTKRPAWPLAVTAAIGLILMLWTAGQAVTIAWLSAFPERQSQLAAMEVKFWMYSVATVLLLAVVLAAVVALVRRRLPSQADH